MTAPSPKKITALLAAAAVVVLTAMRLRRR
jgi:MYXO-CTERM domain-containing protein